MDMAGSSTNLENLLMMDNGIETSSTAGEKSTMIILMSLRDRLITATSESRTNTGSITKVHFHLFRRYLIRCQTRPRKTDLLKRIELRRRVQSGPTTRKRAFPPLKQDSDPRSVVLGQADKTNMMILNFMIEYHFLLALR